MPPKAGPIPDSWIPRNPRKRERESCSATTSSKPSRAIASRTWMPMRRERLKGAGCSNSAPGSSLLLGSTRKIEPQRASHPDMVQGSILLLLVAGLLAGGCSSASTNKKTDAEGPEPIGKLVEATNKPAPIGKLLAELDMQMRSWNNECLTAQTAEDRTKARLLEKN